MFAEVPWYKQRRLEILIAKVKNQKALISTLKENMHSDVKL
jgi:hypothetical protein